MERYEAFVYYVCSVWKCSVLPKRHINQRRNKRNPFKCDFHAGPHATIYKPCCCLCDFVFFRPRRPIVIKHDCQFDSTLRQTEHRKMQEWNATKRSYIMCAPFGNAACSRSVTSISGATSEILSNSIFTQSRTRPSTSPVVACVISYFFRPRGPSSSNTTVN